MFTKKAIFMLLIVLSMGTLIHAQSKGTIVFVSYQVDTKIGKLPSRSAYQYPEPDGEVVMFAGGLKKTDKKGVYKAAFLRSKDNGLTLKKDVAIIRLPQ